MNNCFGNPNKKRVNISPSAFSDTPELMEHLHTNYKYWKEEEEKDGKKKLTEGGGDKQWYIRCHTYRDWKLLEKGQSSVDNMACRMSTRRAFFMTNLVTLARTDTIFDCGRNSVETVPQCCIFVLYQQAHYKHCFNNLDQIL